MGSAVLQFETREMSSRYACSHHQAHRCGFFLPRQSQCKGNRVPVEACWLIVIFCTNRYMGVSWFVRHEVWIQQGDMGG